MPIHNPAHDLQDHIGHHGRVDPVKHAHDLRALDLRNRALAKDRVDKARKLLLVICLAPLRCFAAQVVLADGLEGVSAHNAARVLPFTKGGLGFKGLASGSG
jgi:hypothetical protein